MYILFFILVALEAPKRHNQAAHPSSSNAGLPYPLICRSCSLSSPIEHSLLDSFFLGPSFSLLSFYPVTQQSATSTKQLHLNDYLERTIGSQMLPMQSLAEAHTSKLAHFLLYCLHRFRHLWKTTCDKSVLLDMDNPVLASTGPCENPSIGPPTQDCECDFRSQNTRMYTFRNQTDTTSTGGRQARGDHKGTITGDKRLGLNHAEELL